MATEKKVKNYDESNVQNLSGLTAVRKKASMYIGDLDIGVWTILREAADNTVDEANAGRNDICYMHLGKSGFWVADNGQGIPTGNIEVEDSVTHKKHKVSAFKAIVSMLHSGGKFDDKAYAASRGTHGVGIKATNALSNVFKVWTFYKGEWWFTEYAKGKVVAEVAKAKKPPVLPGGKKPKKGTVMYFEPDTTILKGKFPMKLALDWAKVTAYLQPKFRVILETDKKKKEFYFENGPKDLVKDKLKELNATPLGKPFFSSTPLADVAIVFSDFDGQAMEFYTNGLHNTEGGTHASSVYAAILKAVKPYAKARKSDFTVHDLKEGVLGLVNAKLSSPQFSSQDKIKLVDERTKGPLEEIVLKDLTAFFKANKALAARICERAAQLKELKGKFTASKAVLKELNSIRSKGMPGKFAGANKAKPEDRETFLVEGDSAGGTAKKARDKDFQEVLPLKGKIMNVMKGKKGSIDIESEEVIFIFAALGFDPKAADPYAKLRTGKIICLADPDPDGYHINALILTLLYKYLPGLYDRGMVYVVDAPEYYAQYGKKDENIAFGYTLADVMAKIPKGTAVSHIKGWGEIDAEILEPLAFDPKTRNIIKVMPVDNKGKIEFQKLMGDDVAYRKELLGV